VMSVLLTTGAPVEVQTQVRSRRRMNESCLTFLQIEGWTPLHVACRRGGQLEVVSLLLTAGAQIDARDKVGGICEYL
jgi:hypothetical protein